MRHPMLFALYQYSVLSLPTALSTTAFGAIPPIRNSNHIFNVIHDSMRQWGSSLHHNGVSFFLAAVPAGTYLYHGAPDAMPVNGTEWLAFEPEHALVFARPRWGPGPPPGAGRGQGESDGEGEREDAGHGELRRRDREQGIPSRQPAMAFDGSESENGDEHLMGYLHTYAARENLRLLYIDGMSAAKTEKGTLDSQDAVLFNGLLGDQPGWMGLEAKRARLACEMAENEWEGRIDGLLRMEAGFEIILCDFERDLVPVRITQAKLPQVPRSYMEGHGRSSPHSESVKSPNSSRWLRAIATRYHGIGGNRVSLNFEHFVTAFSHHVDLFQYNTTLPRLAYLSGEERNAIREEITDMILTHDVAEVNNDWQMITDMIILRYSNELAYFSSGGIDSIEHLHSEIERVLSPFIDYSAREDISEIERCATQFLPTWQTDSLSVAARAVFSVASRICSDLVLVAKEQDLETAVGVIRKLVQYLDWTTWKECRGCAANEICVVPIWPMGTIQDYERPECRDASDPYGKGGENYWNAPHH
ncbi:hypothetical protein N7535_008079 [Penicillium sp. DV-2018c]|nr:hypothetical protein N7461_004116 [Penicillium sp. DV-2018c]KAJ5566441.1 hypothetical protein N7535_008079 [Penicillium sp. DV-2018c]